MNEDIKIIYVNNTFAYRQGNKIYMHEDLKHNKYIHLHRALLDHELQHVDDVTFADFLHDLKFRMPKDEYNDFKRTHRDVMFRMRLPINRFGINYNLLIIDASLVIMTVLVYLVTLWLSLKLL